MLLRRLHAVATPSLLRRRGRFMVLRRVVLHRGAFHRQNARVSNLFASLFWFRAPVSNGERKRESVVAAGANRR